MGMELRVKGGLRISEILKDGKVQWGRLDFLGGNAFLPGDIFPAVKPGDYNEGVFNVSVQSGRDGTLIRFESVGSVK